VSDFFSRLEQDLERAAERRSKSWVLRLRWTRRSALVLIPAIVLASVPAFAAVHEIVNKSHPHRPAVFDLNRDCHPASYKPPPPSTAPPPADALAILAVLRRPQTPADALPNPTQAMPVAGINPTAVRLALSSSSGAHVYLIPAQDINFQPETSNIPGCPHPPKMTPKPGVCVLTKSHGGAGGSCFTAAQISEGTAPGGLSGGGIAHGAQLVSGVVPDGVTRVTLIWSKRGRVKRVDVPVKSNVYLRLVRDIRTLGRPTVIFHDASGSRVVSVPTHTTPRQRRLLRASARRDAMAGPRPSLYPPRVHPTSVVELRFRRTPPDRRGVYMVTLRGPAAYDCRQPARARYGAVPSSHGKRKGLISIPFAPQGFGGTRWCKDTYRGTITYFPRGVAKGLPHRVYARFSFTVG
jgi:hypothetical protein